MPRLAVTAKVRPDRCFKGASNGALIPVLFDGFVSGVDPSFVLRKGDYRLLFLKAQNGKYAVVDKWFGALSVSRELGLTPENSDGMYLLELDLKAGLRDSQYPRVAIHLRRAATPQLASLIQDALRRRSELAPYARLEIYRMLAAYLQTEISSFPDELVERLSDEQYLINASGIRFGDQPISRVQG